MKAYIQMSYNRALRAFIEEINWRILKVQLFQRFYEAQMLVTMCVSGSQEEEPSGWTKITEKCFIEVVKLQHYTAFKIWHHVQKP